MTVACFYIWLIFGGLQIAICLENGVARTPPMGWLAWERFKCNTNCRMDPNNCISEKLFMEMADRIVADGYRDAGYTYINLDDCWMAKLRDYYGNLVPDPERFPRGINFLSNYMHSLGLKLGIYQDFGRRTCMGYPGIVGHMKEDAQKFAEWNVDMVKLDGCHSRPENMDRGYVSMGRHLNNTGRNILYSCSWPYYQLLANMEPNYKLISSHCNMWRNFHDIQDSWESIKRTIEFFGDNQEVFTKYTGPGHWSDPDMLMIGNFHLTPGQARVQMAVWAMLPAPLLMSNDLRSIKPVFKAILLNRKVIAINQDFLGLPGKRIYKEKEIEVWRRPISPSVHKKTSFAVLFFNGRDSDKNVLIKVKLRELGLKNYAGYFVTDVFRDVNYGIYLPDTILKVKVAPMDVVLLNCKLQRK